MRIEIVNATDDLNRERYEFIVRVDSLAIRIELTKYTREHRETKRHRTWHPLDIWTLKHLDKVPLKLRRERKPIVPLHVQKAMRANFEKAVAYNYRVNYESGQLRAQTEYGQPVQERPETDGEPAGPHWHGKH